MMRVVIDPGHGGRDPGGGSRPPLFLEKDLVLSISLYQAEMLYRLGHEVILTREKDETVDPKRRAQIIKMSGARLGISNHINACGDPRVRGLEVFHSIHTKPATAEAIAKSILACGLIGPRTGLPVVRTRTLPYNPRKDYYFVHRETGAVPVVLIEYGFASNLEDAAILFRHWRILAEAVVRAIDHLAKGAH